MMSYGNCFFFQKDIVVLIMCFILNELFSVSLKGAGDQCYSDIFKGFGFGYQLPDFHLHL